jgi:hypothetical protein
MLGNHDHDGNAQAQINYYLHNLDNRWKLPDFYWWHTIPVDNKTNTSAMVSSLLLHPPIICIDDGI